jgi:hypothetical protein
MSMGTDVLQDYFVLPGLEWNAGFARYLGPVRIQEYVLNGQRLCRKRACGKNECNQCCEVFQIVHD